METVAGSAILLLVGVSVAVSVRLLARWLRDGGTPELMLGVMLFLTVGIGYPALIAASRLDSGTGRVLFLVSNVSVNVGFSMLFLFTWRVFRPEAAWARVLTGLGMLALAVSLTQQVRLVLSGSHIATGAEVPRETLWQMTPVTVAYAWTAWEALRYYALMRRRVRLDLADPAVCNRLLLWGLMSLFVISGLVLNSAALLQRIDVLESPVVLLGSSFTGLAQAVLLFLAFLPPRAYLRWIHERATAPG